MIDVSILVISYNTCALLRECLQSVVNTRGALAVEVIVVDNASRDTSAAMVRDEFPWVKLIESKVNLGFGGANNRALGEATGRYIVLLNSDAFLEPNTLQLSAQKMDANPKVGLASGMLVGKDGKMQPGARMFPGPLTGLLMLTGLADRFASSRFFGQEQRGWADPLKDADVDWVPGAYSIIRGNIPREIGFFDPRFFLYYEEVDLCWRIKDHGYKIMYWPEIVIIHIGGESSRQVPGLEMSTKGAQLVLWRMRSTLLFYRKHTPLKTAAVRWSEVLWYRARVLRNKLRSGPEAAIQAKDQERMANLMQQAWKETSGGRISPPQPW